MHVETLPGLVDVEPRGDDWATIELELTQPILKWLLLEKRDHYSVPEWIAETIQLRLEEDLHGTMTAGEVDVATPHEILERATYKYRDCQARGIDVNPDDFLFNYVHFDVNWITEHGNPIEWATDDD